MSTYPITIIEPQIALVTSGALDCLWRVGATMESLDVGDLLWVREPYYLRKSFSNISPTVAHQRGAEPYFATDFRPDMPSAQDWLSGRRVARTLLRVWHRQHLLVHATEERRLHTITDAEARAQGYQHLNHFMRSWDTNTMFAGRDARWAQNPLATIIHFQRIGEPIA